MKPVDSIKFSDTINDAIRKLQFLNFLEDKDDSSSELAGYEISKLLGEQRNLEASYAQLITYRSSLVGISNKEKLKVTQGEILNVAKNLKESTKKLLRLFKENPDLEADSAKITSERHQIILDLEELISALQNDQSQSVQQKILTELETQDLLRKLTTNEKDLTQEIKNLAQAKIIEQKEYLIEITEKQKMVQNLKETLTEETKKSEMQIRYEQKESNANVYTAQRIYGYKEKQMVDEIDRLKNKIKTETLVHQQLKEYLVRKEEEVRKQGDDWNRQYETLIENIQNETLEIQTKKEKDLEELSQLQQRFKSEQELNLQKEKEELQKLDQDKQSELQQIRLNNAINLIQREYLLWKSLGGGKKKKKGKKKK